LTRNFPALYVEENAETREVTVGIKEVATSELPAGDVLIEVRYSDVNYKDALATVPSSRVVRHYPMIPGIDLSGVVVESRSPRFREGDEVLVTGYDLGTAHFGGFSRYARVHADWVVPLPAGLSHWDAMALGTAGFTAALAIQALQMHGIRPESGPVLVTGATGGAGSIAVNILADQHYEVAASTGKSARDYLTALGASRILSREDVSASSKRPLDHEEWAGGIDSIGGTTLEYLLRTTQYGGSVAAFGMRGGSQISTSVFPFILRGIHLLGIDSVNCPYGTRTEIWQRLAGEWKPSQLNRIVQNTVSLQELPKILEQLLQGSHLGRTVVDLTG
jgi:putative YhdH/YhfP family quinone oxidoreductase